MMGSAQQYHRVGPALATRGYRAIAVDLPGHGNSPTARSGLSAWAAAVTDAVSGHPALAIGQSLGGVVLAASALQPARAVYVDIPLTASPGPPRTAEELTAKFTAAQAGRTLAALRKSKPAWSDADRQVEATAAQQFDVATAVALELANDKHPTPATDVPSLVIHANPSRYVSATRAAELQAQGFTVRAIPAADHTLWYSHFAEFMAALDNWPL
ncbi:alpha/beta fold hydrolase [Kribbella antibiotica]|uniref:Alpha/beta fold hydrolase n=2 Tax=Kribbella antibiotica TaxID=190195 RepID=A0A4V6PE75_9ACTN|nr:alpha/beta fold hydrolase [Kribbella antibiotica]